MQPRTNSIVIEGDEDSAISRAVGNIHSQKRRDSSNSNVNSSQKSALSKRNGTSVIPNQAVIPDENTLSCRDFYSAKGSDSRRFCAMMIGVSKEVHGIELSMQDEPILSYRREMRPTNIILQEELLRRALLCKTRILPRPSQWERDKILAHLKEVYPPQLTDDDLTFLSERLSRLLEYYSSKKEQQQDKVKENGWSMINTHLRFYHSLIEAKKTTAAPLESEEFWRTVAEWMNDKAWVPNSLEMPHIDDEFQQCRQLVLQLNDSVSWETLRSRFYKLRKTLTLCHPGETFDTQTTSRSHPRLSPRVMYFITFLYSCGLDREDFKLPNTSIQIPFPISDNSSNVCSTTVYVEHTNKELSQIPKDQDLQVSNEDLAPPDDSVTCVEPSIKDAPAVATSVDMPVRAVTMDPSSLSPSLYHCNEKSDASNFLESSKLYLQHMDCYIRLEKDLFELEERSVALSNNGLGKDHYASRETTHCNTSYSLVNAYAATCERKKESLNALKRRMCELAYVSDLLSKRIRSNEL